MKTKSMLSLNFIPTTLKEEELSMKRRHSARHYLSALLGTGVYLLSGAVWAATIFVNAANDTGIEDGTAANPYNTIQEGIDAAAEGSGNASNNLVWGDEVSVAPGIYHGTIELKHLVKLISEQGPEVTIIDGMSGRYAVRSPWYEPGHQYSYLEGFTVRNANTLIEDTERNHIYWWCDMEVHNSVLEGRIVNGQGWGTGIYKGPHARVVTTRTTFRDLGNGFSTFWGPVTTENVTMDNVFSAFTLYGTVASLTNTTVTGSEWVVALWGNSGWATLNGSHNNLFDYVKFAIPTRTGRYPTNNLTDTLSVDPLFVDPQAGDLRLQTGSPLIDAGIDIGFPYLGSAPDIGAYEYGSVSELLEGLAESYQDVPLPAFKNSGEQRRHALQNKLVAVLESLDSVTDEMTNEEKVAILEGARNKLEHDLLAKADGHFGGNPLNDWITSEEEQALLREKVLEIIEMIDADIAALMAP